MANNSNIFDHYLYFLLEFTVGQLSRILCKRCLIVMFVCLTVFFPSAGSLLSQSYKQHDIGGMDWSMLVKQPPTDSNKETKPDVIKQTERAVRHADCFLSKPGLTSQKNSWARISWQEPSKRAWSSGVSQMSSVYVGFIMYRSRASW